MSSNTQEQGRSYYTERDYAFTPTRPNDIYYTEIQWERGLLAATRIGDPSFDYEAKAAIINPTPAPEPDPGE